MGRFPRLRKDAAAHLFQSSLTVLDAPHLEPAFADFFAFLIVAICIAPLIPLIILVAEGAVIFAIGKCRFY